MTAGALAHAPPRSRSAFGPSPSLRAEHPLHRLQRRAGNAAVSGALSLQRSPASELIASHTSWGNLHEEDLGKALVPLVTSDPALVVSVLRTVSDSDRDDVAVGIVDAATDADLEAWGSRAAAKPVLVQILGELSGGSLGADEVKARDRVMGAVPNDRPGHDTKAHDAAVGTEASAATAKIKAFTDLGGLNLDEEKLGADLAAGLPGNRNLVEAVVQQLEHSDDDDDVAVGIIDALTDPQLAVVAGTAEGREVLALLVRQLNHGRTILGEQQRMQRAMAAISGGDRKAVSDAGGKHEVEVLSFLYGGSAKNPGGGLDKAGALIGSRGHTLIQINGRVYSYELGWSAGRSKAEYLAANSWRDGVGQVLTIHDTESVAKVQAHLDGKAGTGIYAVGGDICTDSTAQALLTVLKGLPQQWTPGTFMALLDAKGVVESRRFYPQTARPRK